tara:strand:+ start:24 stop:290 length:267 start_codon:yes stop_codon:yes gene_type:complete
MVKMILETMFPKISESLYHPLENSMAILLENKLKRQSKRGIKYNRSETLTLLKLSKLIIKYMKTKNVFTTRIVSKAFSRLIFIKKEYI